jgi:hypothetical protein
MWGHITVVRFVVTLHLDRPVDISDIALQLETVADGLQTGHGLRRRESDPAVTCDRIIAQQDFPPTDERSGTIRG